MLRTAKDYAMLCKIKVDSWFKRAFKEQAGGAELIATLVIIGIVLVLAFVFKDKLTELVQSIWNNLIKDGTTSTSQSDIVSEWP